MTTTVVENETRPLLKTDLCDKCGVVAMKVARNEARAELFFCDHHAYQYREALVEKGFYIDVETLEERIGIIEEPGRLTDKAVGQSC